MSDPAVADPLERVATSIEALATTITTQAAERDAALRALIDERMPAAPPPEPVRNPALLPGGERVAATDRMRDPFTAGWWDDNLSEAANLRAIRANFELAKMIQGGARQIHNPVTLAFRDDFERAARFHIHEDPRTERPLVITGYTPEGMPRTRAMDTQETGFGLELIGAQYVSDLWAAARNNDSIVGDIRTIPMTAPTAYIPIDGALPEMLLVSENTSASSTAYTTTKTASNRRTLTAKKFTIQQIWSGELEEDSIIAWVPFLREQLGISAALHLGSAYLNGDETNAGTGNINLDDANPADTKHYLAWDGIRHYWLIDATGQGKNMAAALDIAEINVARGKLNGADDDIDNAVGNINWGLRANELRIVCDWDTYMALLDADKVVTPDKYGPAATILTGELGKLWNIPIISPSYATKTEADGKASDTEASNTKGQITLFNPRAFVGGLRRGEQFYMSRLQGRDQMLIEVYTRRAFQRFGGNVSAGIYNISV